MQSVRSEIEGALAAVRQCLGQPWAFSRLPAQSSRSRLGTRGVDDWLTFPLTNAAQLLALHPDGRIPLSHLYIEHDEPDVIALSDIMAAMDAALAPPSAYQAYLSHVAIDTSGSASILAPMDPPRGSFATLWVELPSTYVGGETTLAYEGSSLPTQLWPRHCDLAAAYNDVDVHVSPIVSGHRVLLVFSLALDECATSVRTAPLSVPAGIARVAATAALPGATHRIWGYHLQHPVSALEWHQVVGSDRIAALALCSTGVYDVALVEHAPYNADDDDDHTDGPATRAWSVRLAGGVLFPETRADPSLVDGLSNKTVAMTPRARFSLAFWATSQRAHVAGHRVTGVAVYRFVTTQATWQAPDAYLGYPTGDALLMAWFETFGSRRFFDTVERERYLDTSMLCDLLLQQRRLDLIECFLQDHCVYFIDCARDYASFIHSVLTIYGWEPLASTLEVLLTKWPLVGAMRLVASLAGVALDPVCPHLQRPFAKELIKTCFCRLVVVTSTAVGADFGLWRNGIAGLQQLVADVLVLQTYLMTLSESAQHGSYLDAYLPAPLVHLVDSFLVPLSFVDAVILKQRSIFDPVAVVGPAVLTLRKHVPPATLAPLVAPLLATAQELPNDMTLHGLIAYLCLAPDLGMDLITTMATRYPLLFVPAMRAVAKDHRDALDVMAIGAMVLELSARLFEDEATTFVTEHDARSSQLVVHYEQSMAWPTTATVVEFCIVGLLTDATTFLDAYAPSQLQAFAAAWTDALRRSARRIAFFTHCVFCLLYTLHDVCARHKDVGVFLASTCRTELGAIAAQVAATLPPLTSVAMAIDDELTNDCASCVDFATFLHNAVVREYIGKNYATTGTLALCAHVRAIAVPAQCLRMEDRQSFLGSVYIRKEPRGVDVAAWDALATEHMMLAGLPSRMRYMDEWIAAWTSEEATASGASL